MLKVGVTGGIGSGKSLVCSVLQALCVPVYSADEKAKMIMHNDEIIKEKIIDLLGENCYTTAGLNAQFIANQVFNDKNKLNGLNAIIHPAVIKDFNQWCKLFVKKDYVVIEAALIFESETYKYLDLIVCVTTPLEERIQRVIKRDGISRNEVLARVNKQFDENIVSQKSDYIINNDENSLLLPRIIEMHNRIIEKNR